MAKFHKIAFISILFSTSVPVLAESVTLYSLEIGGKDSIYKQLGVNRGSFYLEDGNFSEQLRDKEVPERKADQIACKQSGFGIKKALSNSYHKLTGEDEYLKVHKETLNKRILDDLATAEVSLVSETSKRYAQPECEWTFNSAQYANATKPTVVSKFESKSGIDKLTKLHFSVDHQGTLLSLDAEQITERLNVEKLDAILNSISRRYSIELESISSRSKKQQESLLKDNESIVFEKGDNQCEFTARNTYYRSEAAADAFGIEEAHGYIALKCENRKVLEDIQPELAAFISEKVHEAMANLLDKHKADLKNEGQKEKNAGFVF